MGDNLRKLGDQINVELRADEGGYFGRECSVEECLGYFKVIRLNPNQDGLDKVRPGMSVEPTVHFN